MESLPSRPGNLIQIPGMGSALERSRWACACGLRMATIRRLGVDDGVHH